MLANANRLPDAAKQQLTFVPPAAPAAPAPEPAKK
jgi:hypothetical protein